MKPTAILCVVVMVIAATPRVMAEENCTHLSIELNGKPAPLPQSITLTRKGSRSETKVSVSNGCFQLPKSLERAKAIDVVFQVNSDTIHLRDLRPFRFEAKWKLILQDTAFSSDVAIPTNTPAREICVVEFDDGGDPGVGMSQNLCRSAATDLVPQAKP